MTSSNLGPTPRSPLWIVVGILALAAALAQLLSLKVWIDLGLLPWQSGDGLLGLEFVMGAVEAVLLIVAAILALLRNWIALILLIGALILEFGWRLVDVIWFRTQDISLPILDVLPIVRMRNFSDWVEYYGALNAFTFLFVDVALFLIIACVVLAVVAASSRRRPTLGMSGGEAERV